ncbi:hypothetical protein L1785_02365 [Antribacter sp. KLBMP9083]|uniref:Uncharacterized protein n=1 Tax=Antribacter soli TaxID=2910976 RepID=A0AA41QAR0_9MICO|nr:hypothetical protein [Antribacter soli]MCF4119813.1 hypothetical protein [Antribacter soli]
MSAGREDGRILLLTAAFTAFALMLVAVVASATAVHLDRKRVHDLADLLAADAAHAVAPETFYDGPGAPPEEGAVLSLTDAGVRDAVGAYLDGHRVAAPDGLTVVEAGSPDGRSARVTLAAVSRPPLVGWFTDRFGGGVPVSATATARAW